MHRTTGRWKLGFGLALVTALLWGVLPIALKLLLGQMDPYSITWYRFVVAAALLGAFQLRRGELPRFGQLAEAGFLLLAIAIAGLLGNYALYLIGLNHVTPGAAQMVIQLAPVLLLLGGLVFFGERFGALQWSGFAALVIGLGMFFNHRLEELLGQLSGYTVGVLFVLAAAVSWASYALAQKQLLKTMASENIMLLIYVAGAVAFLPVSSPASIADLDAVGIALLVFASFNTLIAYGSFAEALDHWEASRVSAVLAIAPLLTIASVALLDRVGDFIDAEPLNHISLIGGALVVAGSMTMSLASRRPAPTAP